MNDLLEEQVSGTDKAIRENKATISFMVEGMQEEVAATLYEGSNYSIYIPDEGWQMYAPEAWMSDINEKAQIWIADYSGESVDAVKEQFTQEGYTIDERGSWVKYDGDNAVMRIVKVVTNDDAIKGIFYCYPAEAEEGFGTRLDVIINTFAWLN